MYKKLFLFGALLFWAHPVLAEGKFCFRDSIQNLICKNSMDEIPLDYQRKVFFLSPEHTNSKNSSVTPRRTAPSARSTNNINQTSESIRTGTQIQDSPRSNQRVTRDEPLSVNPASRATLNKSVESPESSKISTVKSPEINNHKIKIPEQDAPPLKTHVSNIESSPSLANSGLPPAKGYEPPPPMPPTIKEPAKETTPSILPSAKTNITSLDPTENPTKTGAFNKDALVQIYVADWCSHCKALEKFLISEKISYNKYDIEKDPDASSLYEIHGSVPISKIGNNIVVGFDAERYRAFLDATIPY
jgi:glutaredoxin